MRRFITAALTAGAVGLLPHPQPADAQGRDCLGDAVSECDADFPNHDFYLIAIRGWCYIIRGFIC